MRVVDEILGWGERAPAAPALEVMRGDGSLAETITYGALRAATHALGRRLIEKVPAGARVGVVMGNTPGWVAADLALLGTGRVEVPVPLAFSAEQAASLLDGCDVWLVDEAGDAVLERWGAAGLARATPVMRVPMGELIAEAPPAGALPVAEPEQDFICKVIHTSGTTNRPKGVKIRYRGVADLLASLRRRAGDALYQRYLSLVPFSLLIEQVMGIYRPLAAGGTLVLLSRDIPLVGSPSATARGMLDYIKLARPTALTLSPAIAEAMHAVAESRPGASTRELSRALFGLDEPTFLGCGGAPVEPRLLQALTDRGLPIYEGYGLSENSSVVSWNSPGHYLPGTVGQPLDHVHVRLGPDGELLVKSSSLFAGYTNGDPSALELDADGWLHTGDLAELDANNFIRIRGRKKNLIITSTTRNVAPEWVESRYKTLPFVQDVVIFGDGLERIAGLFLIHPGEDLAAARERLRSFGEVEFSEIERVGRHYLVHDAPEIRRELFTVTGRPVRQKVQQYLKSNPPPGDA